MRLTEKLYENKDKFFQFQELEDCTLVVTNVVDKINDCIEVYIYDKERYYILEDNGYIMENLMITGKLDDELKEIINKKIDSLNISLDSTIFKFRTTKNHLIQNIDKFAEILSEISKLG